MKRFRAVRLSLLASAFAAAGVGSVHAQDATNEAWIGQTGETNVIAITQTGIANYAGNSIGTNGRDNLINQDGRFNTITIDQFGWSNRVGADDRELGPEGVDQVGDRNVIEVRQSNGSPAGSNTIGALWQRGISNATATTNSLQIRQSATDAPAGDVLGDGEAGHTIGSVVQDNPADAAPNVATIRQIGGFEGQGNTIERVYQVGSGNLIGAEQFEYDNLIGLIRQVGTMSTDADRGGSANEIVAIQRRGTANTIESIVQVGDGNKARVDQAGNRNVVSSVYQNNEGIAISGNTVVATFAGDDNGGDGFGGLGAFAHAVAADVGVFQGAFSQIGDDNRISFTVNGGDENLFGVRQSGDGNGAIIAIGRASENGPTASRNEVAVLQYDENGGGDDNNLALDLIGNDNVVGVVMKGNRNLLKLSMTGDENIVDAAFDGDHNNGSMAGSFDADRAALGLAPGQGLQNGNLNRARIRVSGDLNLVAFAQEGDLNTAEFDIVGTGNQSVVSQSADGNTALLKQSGSGNALSVRQY